MNIRWRGTLGLRIMNELQEAHDHNDRMWRSQLTCYEEFVGPINVRSLTLDVKVWEPSVISLFKSLGNAFANSVWEELLQSISAFQVDLVPPSSYKSDKPQLHFITKPNPADSISVKEKFIHAKYAEKLFVRKPRDNHYPHSVAQQIWEAVRANDKKAVYRLLINHEADVNAVYEQASCSSSLIIAKNLGLLTGKEKPPFQLAIESNFIDSEVLAILSDSNG
ncbi:hypothetical protein Tsubulata_025706 [Turnera subulata]|uniref:Uncharacterized protein n=1 Tax=Turnera subulata TaxID=218843 RepID=A0A9Q0FNI1_9ROSI|nr:hypothetical protein Tsubulata_025706 [Turnera subulata]